MGESLEADQVFIAAFPAMRPPRLVLVIGLVICLVLALLLVLLGLSLNTTPISFDSGFYVVVFAFLLVWVLYAILTRRKDSGA
jgi:high-affinity Fe2+/Pb2+ permease